MWRVLFVVLASCAHENPRAHESPTASLHLVSDPTGDESDRVRGVVHAGDDVLPAPVQFVAVELLRDGHVVRSTNTDHEGRFVFAADVPRGDYDLRLTGEYIGSAKVVWNGHARDGLVIRAQRR